MYLYQVASPTKDQVRGWATYTRINNNVVFGRFYLEVCQTKLLSKARRFAVTGYK